MNATKSIYWREQDLQRIKNKRAVEATVAEHSQAAPTKGDAKDDGRTFRFTISSDREQSIRRRG